MKKIAEHYVMKFIPTLFGVLCWCIFGTLYSNPWGKDADLHFANPPLSSSVSDYCATPLLGLIGEKVIHFHQEVISPTDGPRSHFMPSSSYYTRDAIRKHGFFQGFLLGCDRLMRENEEPWVYSTVSEPGGVRLLKWNPVR